MYIENQSKAIKTGRDFVKITIHLDNDDRIIFSYFTGEGIASPSILMKICNDIAVYDYPNFAIPTTRELYMKRLMGLEEKELVEELLFQYEEFLSSKRADQYDLEVARMSDESPSVAMLI